MKLKGKVAIISGASRGIGRATAEMFVKEGAKVVINYLKSEKAAQEIVASLGGDSAIAIKADVSKELDVKHLVELTLKTFGKIDILVNNAGEILRPSDWNCDSAIWRRTLEINLTSVWLLSRECLPHLVENSGNIVNVSSVYGSIGAATVLPYTVAKSGTNDITISLAKEFGSKVRVNAVAPGNIMTDMTKDAGIDFVKWAKVNTPMKRLGNPEEVAKAITFLASDDASFITGHILNVDGGFILK
jgi:3-oxoacyl-[acyl-carrier protein] reductase